VSAKCLPSVCQVSAKSAR